MQQRARRLYGSPHLLQDWGDEADGGPAKYWELFLDLLMVAGVSSVADGIKENPTVSSVFEYSCIGLLMINGWMYYNHFSSRFGDNTLVHFSILFIYCIGFGLAIIGASYETYLQFSLGSILQRMSILVMFSAVYFSIPRARSFATIFVMYLGGTSFFFLLSMCIPADVQLYWWIILVAEMIMEYAISHCLPGTKLIPIDIEHSNDRLGCLVLVMLGETVVSSTISFREYVAGEKIKDIVGYYWVLVLAFLLIFNFTLLYFHMQPRAQDHAARRSRSRGIMFVLAHKFLAMALLFVGVGVKLAVVAAVDGEQMSRFSANLLGISVGVSLVILHFIRILHYGGVYPRGTEPQWAIRLMKLWWGLFGFMVILPFFVIFMVSLHPVAVVAPYAIQIFVMCVFESSFTHYLGPFLVNQEEGNEEEVEEIAAQQLA